MSDDELVHALKWLLAAELIAAYAYGGTGLARELVPNFAHVTDISFMATDAGIEAQTPSS